MKKYAIIIACFFCTIITYGQNKKAQDKFVKQLFNDFKNNRLDKIKARFVDSFFLDELIIKSKKNEEAVTEKYDNETIYEQRHKAKKLLTRSLARAYDEFTSEPSDDKLHNIEPTIKIYTERKLPIESFGVQYNFVLDDKEGEIKIPYILCDSNNKRYVIMSERVRFHLIPKEVVEIRGRDYDILTENVGMDEELIMEKIHDIPPPPAVSEKQIKARSLQLSQSAIHDMQPPVPKETRTTPNDVFEFPDTLPEYPGGHDSMMQFIMRNMEYPALARESEIEGRVYCSFIVEVTGEISDIKIMRDIGGGCGQAAVRVLKRMPKWKPGTHKGKAVRVKMNQPFMFIMK